MSDPSSNNPAPRPETSKFKITCDRLEAMARELGPGAQLAPIRRLQTDLGVSLATLDTALAEMELRQIVLRRQGSGIYVAPQARHRRLALICNPASLATFGTSPFWSRLMVSANRRALEREESLAIQFTRPDYVSPDPEEIESPSPLPERLADDISRGRIHGVLALGLPHSLTRWIERQGVPVVAYAGPANYIVMTATPEIIQIGVSELARLGCRRPALLSFADAAGSHRLSDDARTFSAALSAHGLADQPLPPTPFPPESDVELPAWQGYRTMQRLLELPPELRPDGIVSTDDMLTQGALMALQHPDAAAGHGIRVATHSNTGSPALLGWQDSLIRMEFDPEEIVQAMFRTLETLLDGSVPEGLTPVPVDPRCPNYRPPENMLVLRPRLIRPGDVPRKVTP